MTRLLVCITVQRHECSFVVEAPHHRIWRLFHPKEEGLEVPRSFDHPNGSITIHRNGNEDGEGLVRSCTFPVPRWLLSGGVARSFETVVEARKNEYARYLAKGRPLDSMAEGWHTLEVIDERTTRLTFVETYHAHNPILRRLFEAKVHHFISHDNTDTYTTILGHLGRVTRER
jgi:hypothetical protein